MSKVKIPFAQPVKTYTAVELAKMPLIEMRAAIDAQEKHSKKLTQAVFDGLPPEYRCAAVDGCSGNACAYISEPSVMDGDDQFTVAGGHFLFIDDGFDTSDWQNSLIQRETVIPVSEQNQEPDLGEAPEGATHYARDGKWLAWFKQDGDLWFIWDRDEFSAPLQWVAITGKPLCAITQIRAAIALAEKHEDSQPPQVTKSELLDSLKSLIKLNGHRDPISDKLLPPDLQPDPEIGEAMRLVVRAGGAL